MTIWLFPEEWVSCGSHFANCVSKIRSQELRLLCPPIFSEVKASL
ncbi:hypothetical protein HMPREF1860_00243 [Prevotella amnii]|uniref:Uncharacterized protein n=1 Tax=Prevotella amnii TaxID=419005 RepID=A0A134BLI6_9BACT|nr:hypothetical protein HMPREF1860_00243 [Prevotella amnii]